MNLKISLVAFLLLVSFSLIAFAFSLIGVAGSVIDSVWKVVALCLGLSLLTGFAYPHIRGVKRGDLLSTNTIMHNGHNHPGATVINLLGGPTAVAMQSGRVGSRIKLNFQGRQAEGIIVSYASTFSAAAVKITEMEQVSFNSLKS